MTLAAVAVGFVLVVIVLALPTARRDEVSPTTVPAAPVSVVETFDFDPQGDEAENPRTMAGATDGDTSTAWKTERYNTRDFGGLKEGVGLGFDLGQSMAPREVTVTVTPGTSFELRTSADPDAELDGWEVVPGSERADVDRAAPGEPAVVAVDTGGTSARYWLLWITRLGSSSSCCSTEVFDVAFGS